MPMFEYGDREIDYLKRKDKKFTANGIRLMAQLHRFIYGRYRLTRTAASE